MDRDPLAEHRVRFEAFAAEFREDAKTLDADRLRSIARRDDPLAEVARDELERRGESGG